MVLVSAKQCKLRILSNSRFGFGEGASHDAIGSEESVSLGNRLSESNGSLGLGPNAHMSESSEGSHAVAVSGAASGPNSEVLSLMFRRLRILSVQPYIKSSIEGDVLESACTYILNSLMDSKKEALAPGWSETRGLGESLKEHREWFAYCT
jgi:hypothetical protein